MKVRKERVLEFIRERGDDEQRLEAAEADLPKVISLPGDEGLLAQYGVEAEDVNEDEGDENFWEEDEDFSGEPSGE